METTRQKKVSRLLQKELASIIQREGSAYTLHSLVTITQARISPDLSVCKIYLSIFPQDKRKSVIEAIQNNTREIRHVLANKVKDQLRIVPELIFFIDDSLDYADRINELLKK